MTNFFNNFIETLNTLFSHVSNPLDLVVAFIVLMVIGGLALMLALLLVGFTSCIWFLPIVHIYNKIEEKYDRLFYQIKR